MNMNEGEPEEEEEEGEIEAQWRRYVAASIWLWDQILRNKRATQPKPRPPGGVQRSAPRRGGRPRRLQ